MVPPPSSASYSQPLLQGPVGSTLLKMAAPMALGMISVIFSNLVDAYFVGQLGKDHLAAMGFIFPFAFLVMSILMGFGVGAASVLAQMLGRGHRSEATRTASHALLLALAAGVLLSLVGLWLMDTLFQWMGADVDLLTLIGDYFHIWLLGVPLLAIPMIGNSVLRATGNTFHPGLIMALVAVVNLIFDPLLIFGIGPFPRLEMRGAAWATLISWAVTFVVSGWLLIRSRLLSKDWGRLREMLHSWRLILFIGLPAAGTNLLVPVTTSVLTRFVSEYGKDAVAGFAVGGRIESLSMIVVMALASVMTAFVGQNWGAGQRQRAIQAVNFTSLISLSWGVVIFLFLFLIAPGLAKSFNDNESVQQHIEWFLTIIPISFGFYGISMLAGSTFNAIHRPFYSTGLIVVRLFVLTIPLAFLGSHYWGVTGLFSGIALSNFVIGILGYITIQRTLSTQQDVHPREEDPPLMVGELPEGWE